MDVQQKADVMIKMGDIMTYSNVIVIIAIQGLLEALKATLVKINFRSKKPIEILMPYLPMILGALAAFIPNLLAPPELGTRIILGVALGAIGGQVWKIFKTKIDLLKGKL